MPGIVSGLHAEPIAGAITEKLAELSGTVGHTGFLLSRYVVEHLARNAESDAISVFDLPSRGNDIIP